MKKCLTCGTEYPNTFEYFRKKGARADGIDTLCKTCRRKSDFEYRDKLVAKLEADRPNKPVERELTRNGTVRVRFGDGYKIGSGQKHNITYDGSSSLAKVT